MPPEPPPRRSYYEGLPVFRTAMDVVVRVDSDVRGFSKAHRYTLGAKLRDASTELPLLVARANTREGRGEALALLCRRAEELKLLLQIAKEVQAFSSFSRFAETMKQVMSLAQQAEAWRRSTSNSRPEPSLAKGSARRPSP